MRRRIKIMALVMACCLLSMPIAVQATDAATQPESQIQMQTEAATQPESQAQVQTEAEEDDNAINSYDDQKTFGISDELDGLSGNAKYVGSKYRQNYNLDLEKTGITEMLEAAINMLANVVFGIYQFLATVTCSIVYFCLDFSFADLIAGYITKLQTNLINGVFKQLWYFGIVAMGLSLVGNMIKREFAEIIKNVAMVIGVTVISLLLISQTSTILTASTNVTKSASTAIFTGLDNATGVSEEGSYAAVASGSLWSDMIHEPWLTLEFGSLDVDQEVVDEILSLPKGSADRKAIVKDLNKETGCFDKSRGLERLSMLLCYSVPFLMKMIVFIAIALLQVVGQFLAVFIMLLAFIVLVLAMIPRYGTSIIQKWLEKFLDVHLSMLILSFLMALLIWINKMAYSLAGTIGWFIALVLQAVICVVLFMNYKTILFMLLHPRDGMSDMNRMLRRMNLQGGHNHYRNGYAPYDADDSGYSGERRRRNRGGDYEYYDEDYDGDPYYDQRSDGMGVDPYGESDTYRSDPNDSRGRGTNGYRRSNTANRRTAAYPGGAGDADRTGYQPQETLQEAEGSSGDAVQSRPDYEAIRRAPADQELYDMFNDTETGQQDTNDEDGTETSVEIVPGSSRPAQRPAAKNDGVDREDEREEELIDYEHGVEANTDDEMHAEEQVEHLNYVETAKEVTVTPTNHVKEKGVSKVDEPSNISETAVRDRYEEMKDPDQKGTDTDMLEDRWEYADTGNISASELVEANEESGMLYEIVDDDSDES